MADSDDKITQIRRFTYQEGVLRHDGTEITFGNAISWKREFGGFLLHLAVMAEEDFNELLTKMEND